MEAMARGTLVLAPAITGVPELVIAGKTGFLYEPESSSDFVEQVTDIACRMGKAPLLAQTTRQKQDILNVPKLEKSESAVHGLDWVRHAARQQVDHNFNLPKNLQSFTDLFLRCVFARQAKDLPHASSVLQQI
jgi:glycosyltransferase involved in cell wall biosynthesis